LKIEVRKRETVYILDVNGKIVLGSGDQELVDGVTGLLTVEGAHHILINLHQVPYMDSMGIGTLIRCHKRAAERGSTMKLLNPGKKVYDILHIVKLDSVFECFTDEELAIASFGD